MHKESLSQTAEIVVFTLKTSSLQPKLEEEVAWGHESRGEVSLAVKHIVARENEGLQTKSLDC